MSLNTYETIQNATWYIMQFYINRIYLCFHTYDPYTIFMLLSIEHVQIFIFLRKNLKNDL